MKTSVPSGKLCLSVGKAFLVFLGTFTFFQILILRKIGQEIKKTGKSIVILHKHEDLPGSEDSTDDSSRQVQGP